MQYENLINKLIDLGIEEDINTGDITTESIIPESTNATATMTAKQDGVISGLEIVKMVYERFQEDVLERPGVTAVVCTADGDVAQQIDEAEAQAQGLNVKIMVGGAPITQAFADEIGADGYSADAAEAATLAKRLAAA